MIINIPIVLHGNNEILSVQYGSNTSIVESGFDVLDVPFPKECCIGYPTMHAYFQDLKSTGYKRFCGFIQIVQRLEFRNGHENSEKLSVDVNDYFDQIGNPYFSYGYPATLFDAPCKNLGDCDRLTWKAYTYLVDMPTRMNHNKLEYITGFSWGYIEDKDGVVQLLDFEMLTRQKFEDHHSFIREQYQNYTK